MIRPIPTLALLGLAVVAASCRSSLSDERRMEIAKGAKINRTLKEHHLIVAAHRGRVGYVRVEDVSEAGSPAYEWKYIYDLNWLETGFIDQFGNGYRYHRYSPSEQAAQNRDLRLMRMPSDSIQNNVMRLLGIDPATDDVTFQVASVADITGATDKHLAGPGIVPAKAPAEAPAPEPAK